jgi:hypothetical protein
MFRDLDEEKMKNDFFSFYSCYGLKDIIKEEYDMFCNPESIEKNNEDKYPTIGIPSIKECSICLSKMEKRKFGLLSKSKCI